MSNLKATAAADNICRYSFVDGAFLEIVGSKPERYRIEFVDTRTQTIVHSGEIANNHWIRTARQFFTPWQIKVFSKATGALVFSHIFNCRNKKVHISFESRALGDTISWFPAVERFRRVHGCELICSTFMNDLFRSRYSKIKFVAPGTEVKHLYARYRVGWFYDKNGALDLQRNVNDVRLQPLSAASYDILGLEPVDDRPLLKRTPWPRPLSNSYVCIAVHATAQAKYWNNPNGWNDVVRYLNGRGMQVVLLSREGREYMGNRAPEGVIILPAGNIDTVINYLRHAHLFIGIGSGLSWLAWATGITTCVISGFSLPYSEPPDVIRLGPVPGICAGCFNRYRLDAGDWNWCPDHKDSPRAFECSRSITSAAVIAAVEKYLD